MPDDSQFIIDRTHPGRWTITFIVGRLASIHRETLAAAKAQVNRFETLTIAELQSSNDLFFPLLAFRSAQARRAKVRNIGYGVRSDFELNFGRYLPSFAHG